MPRDLIPSPETQLVPAHGLADLLKSAQTFAEQAQAAHTRRAYACHWKSFDGWCREPFADQPGLSFVSLPADPATVALYLTAQAQAGKKVATIEARLAAIADKHSAAGYTHAPTSLQHPAMRQVWSGIKRNKRVAQTRKDAATTDILIRMLAQLPDSRRGLRDRALLLLGFAGAFRRSELVSLDVADLRAVEGGYLIQLVKSKTDQEGAGEEVEIPYGANLETCPVRNLRTWLEAAGITEGPLFRSLDHDPRYTNQRLTAQYVAIFVKRYAKAAGLDEKLFSAHSLRAGLITSAYDAGVSEDATMRQSRHKNARMSRRYDRSKKQFRNNAAAKVGL